MKYWIPEDFEVSSFKYNLSERINMTHTTSGSDDSGLCKYTYNELGFRGDSIKKEGFKIMSIGCSLTEGVAINDDETWSAQFAKLISNGVNMNFGFTGRSNDYISRCLISYYDTIKPDLVLIMYTQPNRKDYFTEGGGVEPFHFNKWGYFLDTKTGTNEHKSLVELSNNEYDIQNWYKNHLLIKYFLESKQCNWVWNGRWLETEETDDNRFDGDYTTIDYGVDNVHPGPKTNKKYATDLFDYINEKKPNYLW